MHEKQKTSVETLAARWRQSYFQLDLLYRIHVAHTWMADANAARSTVVVWKPQNAENVARYRAQNAPTKIFACLDITGSVSCLS